uniref:Uncharacterized protein n=1 Tax=Sphaerodactylus townsendi TaxID=933632 RepID=A0ACB8F7R6_9SAUR
MGATSGREGVLGTREEQAEKGAAAARVAVVEQDESVEQADPAEQAPADPVELVQVDWTLAAPDGQGEKPQRLAPSRLTTHGSCLPWPSAYRLLIANPSPLRHWLVDWRSRNLLLLIYYSCHWGLLLIHWRSRGWDLLHLSQPLILTSLADFSTHVTNCQTQIVHIPIHTRYSNHSASRVKKRHHISRSVPAGSQAANPETSIRRVTDREDQKGASQVLEEMQLSISNVKPQLQM